MNVIDGLSPAAAVACADGAEQRTCCLAGDQARALLKALADPIRLQLVESLATGERCVCELTEQLALGQSRLSFHLKVLKDAGLLRARQQGRWMYYSLRPGAIAGLQQWLDQLLRCCSGPAD